LTNKNQDAVGQLEDAVQLVGFMIGDEEYSIPILIFKRLLNRLRGQEYLKHRHMYLVYLI